MSEPVIQIGIDEAIDLINDGAIVLDVREEDEWATGHAPHALLIRLSELPDRTDELPRDSVIVCVCHVGSRSARAAAFLASQGFNVRNLDGGMVDWHAAGHEVHTPH